MELSNTVVSFDDELLIRVDKNDNVLGYSKKNEVHAGGGIMHRAFSIFLVSTNGEVLLQKRSRHKKLWPCYWSNSCCSHPRKGETYLQAAHRRLDDELGIDTYLEFIYKFDYKVSFDLVTAENELCAVFVGLIEDSEQLKVNKNEIETVSWFKFNKIDQMIKDDSRQFTPWFLMEWQYLKNLEILSHYETENNVKKVMNIC